MSYEVVAISLIVIFFYLITYVLKMENITSRVSHIRLWNIILLVSSLILVFISLLHTFIIEYGINTTLSFITLFWHVEFGLLLVPTALIHIYLYRKTFKKISTSPLR